MWQVGCWAGRQARAAGGCAYTPAGIDRHMALHTAHGLLKLSSSASSPSSDVGDRGGQQQRLPNLTPLASATLEAVRAKVEAEARKHPAAYPQIHVTSSEKGMGLEELRAAILSDIRA